MTLKTHRLSKNTKMAELEHRLRSRVFIKYWVCEPLALFSELSQVINEF